MSDDPSRSTSTASPPHEVRPEAIARWERQRAMGRSTFVWRHGVVGWGIPAALLTVVYKLIQEQGLVWSMAMSDRLRNGIGVAMIVFPMCGWLLGRWLWKTGEANYARMLEEERHRHS